MAVENHPVPPKDEPLPAPGGEPSGALLIERTDIDRERRFHEAVVGPLP